MITIPEGKENRELANSFAQHILCPFPQSYECMLSPIPHAHPLSLLLCTKPCIRAACISTVLANTISHLPHNAHFHAPNCSRTHTLPPSPRLVPSNSPIFSAHQGNEENSTYHPRPQSYSPSAYSSSSTPPSPSVSTCSDDHILHLSREPWISPRGRIAGICRRRFQHQELTSGEPG